MKAAILGELLEAADEALHILEGQIDCITDPDSDIGEQVPNRAARVWHRLNEAVKATDPHFYAMRFKEALDGPVG